jgi:ankyrin repeat protein
MYHSNGVFHMPLYDIDPGEHDYDTTFSYFGPVGEPATPLYYAAGYGFHNLVEHLIIKYPQDVNANGGVYVRPLVAALAGEHFQTADLLHRNGADLEFRNEYRNTPLHFAAGQGDLKVVQKLIEYGADISAEGNDRATPLHFASNDKGCSVLRLLLGHGADVHARAEDGQTPLHDASKWGALDVVRMLLEHGADVGAKDNDGRTALQVVKTQCRTPSSVRGQNLSADIIDGAQTPIGKVS